MLALASASLLAFFLFLKGVGCMSNIIILALPVAGHFNPFVPIANRLIERDHSICWITGRHFKTKVENTGATFHPLPEQWDPGDKEPYAEDIRRLLGAPDGYKLVSMNAIGYEAKEPSMPSKRSLADVLHWEKFGRAED